MIIVNRCPKCRQKNMIVDVEHNRLLCVSLNCGIAIPLPAIPITENVVNMVIKNYIFARKNKDVIKIEKAEER